MSETPGVPAQPGSAQLERLQQLDRRIAQTVGQLIGSLQDEVDRRLSEATGELQRLFEKMKPQAPDLTGAFLQPEDLSELAPPPVSVEVPVPVRVSLSESLAPLLAGLARIDGESGQAPILKALLEESRRFASRAAFLLIRGGEIRGWAAHGLDEAAIQQLNFATLAGPFTRLLSADGTVVLSSAECREVAAALEIEAAWAGVLVPFQIRGQLAGALYADRLEAEELAVGALQVLAYGAGQALETSQLRKGSASSLRLGAGEQMPELPVADEVFEVTAPVAVVAVAEVWTPAEEAPAYEPAAHEPAAHEPAAAEAAGFHGGAAAPAEAGYDAAAYEPAGYDAAAYEPAAYEPAAQQEPTYPAASHETFGSASYEIPSYEAASPEPEPAPASYEAAPAYDAPSYEAAPAYEAPAYEAPSYEAPSHAAAYDPMAAEAPSYEAPAYDASSYAAPAYEAPAYEAPSYEAASYEAPSYEAAPAYEAPSYEAASYEAPSYEAAPAYEAPSYEAASYEAAPASEAPSSFASYETPSYEAAPAYETPAYEPPAVEPPSYEIAYEPAAYQPPAYEPAAYEPAAYEPASFDQPAAPAPSYQAEVGYPSSFDSAPGFEVPSLEPAAPDAYQPSFEMVPEEEPVSSYESVPSYEISYDAAAYAATYEPSGEPSSFDTTFEPASAEPSGDVRFTGESAYELPSEEDIALEKQPEPALEDTNIWEAEEVEDDEPTQIGQSTAAVPQQIDPVVAAPAASSFSPAVGSPSLGGATLGQQTVRLDISQLQSHATQLAQERYGDDTADVVRPAAPVVEPWAPPQPAAPVAPAAFTPTYSPPSFAASEPYRAPAAPAAYDQSEAPTILGRAPAKPAAPPSAAGFAGPAPTEQAPGGFGAGGFGAGEAKEPGGTTEVRPPADLVGPGLAFASAPQAPRPGAASGVEETLREEARRLARLLVSEIKLYNEEIIEEGRRSGNIYDRLKDDIDRSRQMYEERIDPRLTDQEDYFYQELVQRLAGGDVKLLGL